MACLTRVPFARRPTCAPSPRCPAPTPQHNMSFKAASTHWTARPRHLVLQVEPHALVVLPPPPTHTHTLARPLLCCTACTLLALRWLSSSALIRGRRSPDYTLRCARCGVAQWQRGAVAWPGPRSVRTARQRMSKLGPNLPCDSCPDPLVGFVGGDSSRHTRDYASHHPLLLLVL